MVMSYAAANQWALAQADVDTAFLNATLTEEIYMQLPEGLDLIPTSPICTPPPELKAESKRTEKKIVCKLQRALYGLKQSPRAWRQRLTAILAELGYLPSVCDPGAYFQLVDNEVVCILLVYVDDILIACKDRHQAQQFKTQLSEFVKIKDLQACRHILGITVRRDDKGIYLSQTPVIQQLLLDHGLQQCRPVSVPMSPSYLMDGPGESHCNRHTVHRRQLQVETHCNKDILQQLLQAQGQQQD